MGAAKNSPCSRVRCRLPAVQRAYCLIISSQALEQTEQRLALAASRWSDINRREVGLRRAVRARDERRPMLVLLLGSNIGNFDAPAAIVLRRIRGVLQPAICCSLALIWSNPSASYSSHATTRWADAAFKVLFASSRAGRHSTSIISASRGVEPRRTRIEMHLLSRLEPRGSTPPASVSFARSGHLDRELVKCEPDQIERMGVDCGFALRDQWIDDDARFGLSLMMSV